MFVLGRAWHAGRGHARGGVPPATRTGSTSKRCSSWPSRQLQESSSSRDSPCPGVAKRLRVLLPYLIEDAVARAALLLEASAAGLAWLRTAEGDDPHGTYAAVASRVEQRNFAAWESSARSRPTRPQARPTSGFVKR